MWRRWCCCTRLATTAQCRRGKQPSLQGANGVQGNVAFPDGQGMTGVNVLVHRQQSSTPVVDGWYEASGVSGTGFRRAGVSPFVVAGTSAAASMGTTWQGEPGLFTIAYAPIANGAVYDDLLVTTEAVNPLYTGSYSVGPYPMGAVAPSGGPVPTQTLRLVSDYDVETLALAPPNAVVPCGTGTDGTVYTPAQIPATGVVERDALRIWAHVVHDDERASEPEFHRGSDGSGRERAGDDDQGDAGDWFVFSDGLSGFAAFAGVRRARRFKR